MLQTQINYWTLQENKRHNLAQEQLTGEQNAISREQVNVNWFTAKESQRHNVEQEGIGWTNANENVRHNKATESISRSTLAETVRHNKQQEGIGWANAQANLSNAASNRINALVNVGKLQIERDFQPYRKAESVARSVVSWSTSTLNGIKGLNLTADTEKKRAETAQVKKETKYATWDRINNTGNMIGNLLKGYGTAKRSKKVIRILGD